MKEFRFLTTWQAAICYIALLLVYITGLFIPLMENDSAQHATMAMRMYLENDFWNIYVGNKDYLDKPHMHFWLAALSFKIFGVHVWSYRLPAFLITWIGALYTDRLAQFFYGEKVKYIGSLVFLSAQAIILSCHDVRTDAVLTGTTIFGVYYFIKYLENSRLLTLVLGFLGLAIAFGAKGQLAVFVSGVLVLSYIIYNYKWKNVWSWKVLLGFLSYFLFIAPILYAFYVQFDLHPEKVFGGKNNVSGIRFILWDQSFNRLQGNGFQNTSPDYFFFFHTLLWAFLPWSILMYTALVSKLKNTFKSKQKEVISSFGVLLILLVISTSKFKLPHYLNSLFPFLSILVVSFLNKIFINNLQTRRWLRFQTILMSVLTTFVLGICLWSFVFNDYSFLLVSLILISTAFYFLTNRKIEIAQKLLLVTVLLSTTINFSLNKHFYPNLLKYQSGNVASKLLKEENVSAEDIKMFEDSKSWSLCFSYRSILPVLKGSDHTFKKGNWLYISQKRKENLEAKGCKFTKQFELTHYRVTRLSLRFLNPNKRDEVVEKRYLVEVK